MKLSMDGFIKNAYNSVKINKDDVKAGETHMNCTEKKFDEIILTSSSRDIEEKVFTEKLVNKMKNEIQSQEERQSKIKLLREQIQNNTYKTDSNLIASCMLYEIGDKNG